MGRPTVSPLQCGSAWRSVAAGRGRDGRTDPRVPQASRRTRFRPTRSRRFCRQRAAPRRAALHGTALCWIVCCNNAHCVGFCAATTHTVLDCMLQRRTLTGRRPCIQCLRLTVPKSCVDIAAWPRSGRPPVGGADGAGPPARPPTAHSIDDVGVACCAPRGACAAAPLPQ